MLMKLGDWTTIEKLASGGMGELWLAQRALTDGKTEFGVVKKLRPHLADLSEFQSRFSNEIHLQASLIHPNIVRLLGHGFADERQFMIMEYVQGLNLSHLMNRLSQNGERLDYSAVLHLIDCLLSALVYLHTVSDYGSASRLVHRDVNPSNILLSIDGEVKLADFGVAGPVDERSAPALDGHFAYLSPEQAAGEAGIDPRSDLFSAGVVFWELLLARRLFHGGSPNESLRKLSAAHIPSPCSINSDIPVDLSDWVMRLLERKQEERFENVAIALNRFSDILGGMSLKPAADLLGEAVKSLA